MPSGIEVELSHWNSSYWCFRLTKLVCCVNIGFPSISANIGSITFIIKALMADNSFASDYIRNFPSSLPIRSPSPDTKASNKLNRTISPTIELRNQPQSSPQSVKGSRRINTEYETLRSENYELREQLASAQMGGGTFSNDEITRLR